MNNQDLATTLIKLGGVALIVYAVINMASYTPYIISNPYDFPASDAIIVYLTKGLLPILIGLYFIYFGGLIIRRHIPETKIETKNLESLEVAALSILGVYLFYHAISDITAHLAALYKINQMIKSGVPMDYEGQMNPETFAAIVATIIEMALSLWLILGSKGMVSLFNKFRSR